MNFNLTKEQQLIVMGIIASIIIGLGVTTYKHLFERPANVIKIDRQLSQPTTITVHVCGAVAREGVYKLKVGDRLLEAINLAGGTQVNADLSSLNLAEVIKDGQKIEVPLKRANTPAAAVIEERPAIGQVENKRNKVAANQIVNLNTASEKQLDALPGVGPATARAIVEYRKTKGPFRRVEQIMEIPRFGKSKFERIKNTIII